DGLNFAILFHHRVDDVSTALDVSIRQSLMTKFLEDMAGYHLSQILTEADSDGEMTWALAGGFRVRAERPRLCGSSVGPRECRYLLGITREEGIASQGTTMSMVFHYAAPRFDFTSSQRRLLAEAVQHKTDRDIAASLGVSLSAVKKIWAAAFDRASDLVDANEGAADRNRSATRGVQKRHTLLTYVRNHPEELRP